MLEHGQGFKRKAGQRSRKEIQLQRGIGCCMDGGHRAALRRRSYIVRHNIRSEKDAAEKKWALCHTHSGGWERLP